MKKFIRLISTLLAIAACLILWCGCQQKGNEEVTTAPPEITQTEYMLTHVETGIISYDADDFQASGTLILRSDGTGQLTYADRTEQIIYTASTLWDPENASQKHNYRISGKVLTLEYHSETLTFLQK